MIYVRNDINTGKIQSTLKHFNYMKKHLLRAKGQFGTSSSTYKYTNSVRKEPKFLLRVWLSFALLLSFSALSKAQVADFTTNVTEGISPLVVQFTDASTGPVTSWFWNFGNGNTSTLQNPSAVYITPGQYTVSLTVSDGTTNNTKTETNLITVFSSTAPTLNITSITDPVNAPFTASFTFSEDVTGFDLSDISVSNGSVSSFNTVSASVYTAEITPTTDGKVDIEVASGAAIDADTESSVFASFCITADFTEPTPVI